MTVKNVAGDFGGKDKLNPQFKATDTNQDLTQSKEEEEEEDGIEGIMARC